MKQFPVVFKASSLLLAGAALAGLIGCGNKAKVCKIAERTETEVLAVWREGGLEAMANEKSNQWAVELEVLRKGDMGPVEAETGLKREFSAIASNEVGLAKQLLGETDAMKAGQQVPDKNLKFLQMFVGMPPDGKTPGQRKVEYAPRIAANEREIDAHRKAANAFLKAIAQFPTN